jgi:hypothetical protein
LAHRCEVGQHRAVARIPRVFVHSLAALAAVLVVHASVAYAQEAGEGGAPRATRSTGAQLTWQPGPAPELWAAPAIGLGVGGLTIALAVVLGQVASANYHDAIDPTTTQLRASQLASTLPDLSLAANILFAVGGGMALIGTTWLIVLPFSQHPVASVQASIGPGGLSLTGSF